MSDCVVMNGNYIDSFDRRNCIHILESFDSLDHANDGVAIVELRGTPIQRHGAVI